MPENITNAGQGRIEYVHIEPTDKSIQQQKDAHRLDPRLPKNPPKQMGVALPEPPLSVPNDSAESTLRRQPKLLEEKSLTPAQKSEVQNELAWKEFDMGYKYKEPSTPEEKVAFEGLRQDARAQAQRIADRLLNDGTLTSENSGVWIEARMTSMAKERVRIKAFNDSLAKKEQ